MAENSGLCYTGAMLRRTTFQAGPLAARLGPLAAAWGLRPAAGPGVGHAALVRLALRAVARSRPVVRIPRELLRPTAGGPRHTIFLDATDDAAIAVIRETYQLRSAAAACRVALWILDQRGLGIPVEN